MPQSPVAPKTILREEAEAPPLATLAGVDDPTTYWPASLAHLALPYDNAGSDYVTIAEISEAPVAGFVGYRTASVALVPHALVEQVLQSTAATGYEVRAQGPLPIVDDNDAPHRSGFWIEGIERGTRFEPVVNSWRGSDTDVVVPDNSMLMVFGLVPRQTGESEVSWDDPHGPVYDVVRASTISDHQRPKELRQRAYVEIRRDYLLEYCRIKHCAAVAFFYEQRWSEDDVVFDRVIGVHDNVDFNLPGRLLNLQTHHHRGNDRGRQFAQVWGRRMVLPRGEPRVIAVGDPDLVWPGHPGTMTMERAGHEHLMAYVSDKVLQEYEGRSEFEIYPLSGGVSYRNQWSVSYCHRVGRDHIAVEIKKLYEGSRNAVIEHWHRFAVPRAAADADRATNGDRHIGIRAQELVRAYLAMTSALAQVIERLGLSFDQSEIGGYRSQDVEYRGWWAIDGLSSLANVVPLGITRDGFLDRAVDVVIFWESLQQAPLRNTLLRLGIDKQHLANLRSMKLLASLCQLATAGKSAGYRWPDDSAQTVAAWDKELRIPSLRRLFAVNQLRQKAAHRTGAGFSNSLAGDLEAFGIVPAAQAAGWGRAVDSVYDGLIEDFTAIATLLTPSP
ncbi:hypothetical protein [Cupriavidus sp. PET2-C1]